MDVTTLTQHPELRGMYLVTNVTRCPAYALYLGSEGFYIVPSLSRTLLNPDVIVQQIARYPSRSTSNPRYPTRPSLLGPGPQLSGNQLTGAVSSARGPRTKSASPYFSA